MKIMHLSDLHLGKCLNQFNFIETGDQKMILNQILDIADEHHPDCIIIAGDVYDKPTPAANAVALFDYFLTELVNREFPVMIISGNHDSAPRVSFGSQVMKKSQVFISPVYQGSVEPVIFHDDYGEIRFWLLPYIRHDNVEEAIRNMQIDTNFRNILSAHLYVTGAERSDSEENYVGSLENVDAGLFQDFDYVALGHLHRPQNVGSEKIRYCGTPLKYSFSECNHQKSVTFVTIREKNSPLQVETVPLVPARDMIQLKGTFSEIMRETPSEQYARIILTSEYNSSDYEQLRKKFPNMMHLQYENAINHTEIDPSSAEAVHSKSPVENFSDFFQKMNGKEMTDEQTEYIRNLITKIWEDDET